MSLDQAFVMDQFRAAVRRTNPMQAREWNRTGTLVLSALHKAAYTSSSRAVNSLAAGMLISNLVNMIPGARILAKLVKKVIEVAGDQLQEHLLLGGSRVEFQPSTQQVTWHGTELLLGTFGYAKDLHLSYSWVRTIVNGHRERWRRQVGWPGWLPTPAPTEPDLCFSHPAPRDGGL